MPLTFTKTSLDWGALAPIMSLNDHWEISCSDSVGIHEWLSRNLFYQNEKGGLRISIGKFAMHVA
jgi:hypothetical protein